MRPADTPPDFITSQQESDAALETFEISYRADQIVAASLNYLAANNVISAEGLDAAQQTQLDEYVLRWHMYIRSGHFENNTYTNPYPPEEWASESLRRLFPAPDERISLLADQPSTAQVIDVAKGLRTAIENSNRIELQGLLLFGSRMSSVKVPEPPVVRDGVVRMAGSDIDIKPVGAADQPERRQLLRNSAREYFAAHPGFAGIPPQIFRGLDYRDFRVMLETGNLPDISNAISENEWYEDNAWWLNGEQPYFVGQLPRQEITDEKTREAVSLPPLGEARVNELLQQMLHSQRAQTQRNAILIRNKRLIAEHMLG